jgi:hypothetical protein
MPMLAAYQNFCFCFLFLTYVRFVPVSDVLAIFVSDWRCFGQCFGSWQRKSFGWPVLGGTRSTKIKRVSVNPKGNTKTLFVSIFCNATGVVYLQISITILERHYLGQPLPNEVLCHKTHAQTHHNNKQDEPLTLPYPPATCPFSLHG